MSGSLMHWRGTMQFGGLDPFDAFIPRELERESLRAHNHGTDIDKDTAVDSIPGKVEILVGLDVKVGHQLHYKYYKISGILLSQQKRIASPDQTSI